MSEDLNSNSQATSTPPVVIPTSTGNLDESQARLAELERQNKGILNDLRQEREKRQELEARLTAIPAPSSPAVQNGDVNNGNELGAVITPYVTPVVNELESRLEAKSFLSAKTGKTWAEIQQDGALTQKLLDVAKRYGVSGDPYTATVRAYELMKRDEELEAYRVKAAAAVNSGPSSTSLPSGAPPTPAANVVEYDLATWARVGATEWDSKEHLGSFRKVGDKVIFTPKAS